MNQKEMQFWAYLFEDHCIRPIGWFDMTDWQKGFDEVLKAARDIAADFGTEVSFPMKGEYLEEYIEDIQSCITERDNDEDNE